MDALLYRCRRMYESLVDVVLPRSARRVRAENTVLENVALAPMSHELLGSEITTLAPYDDLRDLIQALKYDRSLRSAQTLSHALADYLRDDIASRALFSTRPVLLIPVPLDAKRHRDRGYNQIGLVIDALPQEFKDGTVARIGAPLLERTRTTKAQTNLSRSARLSNVAGAFSAADPEQLDGTHVYLIDDVATTGATLVNAATPLRRAGAEVTLLALARA